MAVDVIGSGEILLIKDNRVVLVMFCFLIMIDVVTYPYGVIYDCFFCSHLHKFDSLTETKLISRMS